MAIFSGILRSKIFCSLTNPLFAFTRRSMAKKKKEKKKLVWPFIIVRPERDDYDECLELMWDTYYRDEPCLKCLGLGKCPSSVFDEHMLNILTQGLSVVAKCKFDGCIVGASLNSGTCPWDPDITDKFACTLSNIKMRQMFQFWAYVQRLPNLWKEACTSKIFEISHLFVRNDDRGRGLGSCLVRHSIDTATDCGYRLIRFDASSACCSHIAERHKMKLIYEIPYCTYIGPNDIPVLDPPPPDTSLKVYVMTPLALQKK